MGRWGFSMARIYLEDKEAPFAGSPLGHLYLVLDGGGEERVIRGGPSQEFR